MISVIIAAKNATNYLAEAIAGIRKQAIECEIILVDDSSTDNTVELAKSLGCKVVANKGIGQYSGVNTGIFASNGDFVLIHDHDDVLADGALSAMLGAFDDSIEVVEFLAKDFISPNTVGRLLCRPEPYWGFLSGAMLFRKAVFDKAGVFDESLLAANVKFLMTIKDLGIKVKRVNAVAVHRRIHNTNLGRTHKNVEKIDYARTMRERLKSKFGKKE